MAIRLGSLGTVALVGATVLISQPVAGQEQGAAPPLVITAFGDKAAPPYTVRRTPWGDPDLQGVWSSDDTAGIPMQRPEQFGNRLIACDLANPNFVKYAESFGAAGRRARTPEELGAALRLAFAAREPTLIEVPVGPMPSPWEFIHMPRVRGS